MPLVDTTTAKLHCRVDDTTEDALFSIWVAVADQQVAEFLNRNVYANQAALDAAVAAAPATLAAATTTYEAAIEAAQELEEGVDRDAAVKYAEEAYAKAQDDCDRTRRGMVVNDSVKAAILLAIGNLYEHRGSDADELPKGSKSLLQPYRVGMGL